VGGGRVAIPCWGCDRYPAPDDFRFNPVGQRLAKEGKKERKKKRGGAYLVGLTGSSRPRAASSAALIAAVFL
jgi:hypothetical protein